MHTQSPGKIIAQVSDTPFAKIRQNLQSYHDKQVTHIQISPVQSHCSHIGPWFRVYQPYANTISNSLGTKQDLTDLIDAAHKFKIGIIVDIVLHHKTGCPLCNPSAVFFWASRLQNWLWTGLFPSSTKCEEHATRFGIRDWGPPIDWNTQTNIDSSISLLSELLQMGVSGFRFDAAKHIEPSLLSSIVAESIKHSGISNSTHLINYGEVLDGQNSICEEYVIKGDDGNPLLTVSNFPLTFTIQNAFKPWGDLRACVGNQSWFGWQAISIADCHDSQEGDSYKFYDTREGALAVSLLLALGVGTPLIYHTFLDDPMVRAAILFYHSTFGKTSACHHHSSADLLILKRERQSVAIINKKTDFVEWKHFEPGLDDGDYKELQFNFSIKVRDNQVVQWGDNGGPGLKIGPREMLFFVANR